MTMKHIHKSRDYNTAGVQYSLLKTTPNRTHPIVLIAAAGLTVFSILGSAAITGLIPVNHANTNEYGGILSEKAVILPLPSPEVSRTGIKPEENRYERTSESGQNNLDKDMIKFKSNQPLVLG